MTQEIGMTTTERVFNAVKELRATDSFATRETVAELTGLKQAVVDDRLRSLADDGRLKRVLRGVYDITEQYPKPRPVYAGAIDGGMVKVEIGDMVETLTPEEARMLGRLLVGFASDALTSESVRHHIMLATDLAAQVKSLQLQIVAIKAGQDQRQLDLVPEGE
jgi:hypothetical protein